CPSTLAASDASAPFGIRIATVGMCSNESGIDRSRTRIAGKNSTDLFARSLAVPALFRRRLRFRVLVARDPNRWAGRTRWHPSGAALHGCGPRVGGLRAAWHRSVPDPPDALLDRRQRFLSAGPLPRRRRARRAARRRHRADRHPADPLARLFVAHGSGPGLPVVSVGRAAARDRAARDRARAADVARALAGARVAAAARRLA